METSGNFENKTKTVGEIVSEEKERKENLKLKKKLADDAKNVEEELGSDNKHAFCKKNDGKGWRCKRLAVHPNTLCSYHLNKLRSYGQNSNRRAGGAAAAAAAKGQAKSQRKKRKKASADGDAHHHHHYYYYSGFGPWRSKSRSGAGDDAGPAATGSDKDQEDEEDEVHDIPGATNEFNDESPVAGDDEEDDGDGPCAGDDVPESKGEGGEGKEEENKSCRKRGRKPVKARSLKSLL